MLLLHGRGIEKPVPCGIASGSVKRCDSLIFRAIVLAAIAQTYPYGEDNEQGDYGGISFHGCKNTNNILKQGMWQTKKTVILQSVITFQIPFSTVTDMTKDTTKAIFFDFDGTIADTAKGIVNTMRETFKEMSLPIPEEEAMLATIGIPLFNALKMLNNLDDAEAQRATDIYRRLFPKYEATVITIFPGVKEILEWLAARGYRLAIVTSRNMESLDIILGRHGISGFFETKITASDNLTPKPAPDMVNALLARMHLDKSEATVVGDTTFDIDMGNNAGCRTVAVTYGNHPKERIALSKPTFMIDNFSELKDIVG